MIDGGLEDGEGCYVLDVPEFIRRHNWTDPALASCFAEDLETLRNAYRAWEQRRDLESRVAALEAWRAVSGAMQP